MRHALVAASAGLLAATTATEVRASGFALREGSADWSANAFAGITAKAYDASTVFTNPAGMIRLGWNEIDVSAAFIDPSFTFQGQNFGALGPVTPGTQGGNLGQSGAAGGAYGVWSASPDLKFGLGVTTPFGQRVTNPTDWVGRFQSQVSSISDVDITVAGAYRVNDHLSIGGGPVINIISARFTQALNIGINPLVGDPAADVNGSSNGVGFDLGVLYQFDEATRVGLNYRSQIHQTITGSQSIFVPPLLGFASPSAAGQLALLNSSMKAGVTLPDVVALGFYHQIDPRWAVMVDVSWTHWSLIKSLTITPGNPFLPPSVTPENWRSTWLGAVGVNYQATERLMLQGGVAYDESPVTNSTRTTRLPDNNRFLLGIGATYAVTDSVRLQASYVHLFFPDGSINNSATPTAGVIVGKYSNSANTFSLGATFRF